MLKILFKVRGEMDIKKLVDRGLKVGNNCSFQPGVLIDPPFCWLIEIGNDVTLAPRVTILAHDASMKRHLGYSKIGKVKIGNRSFIGAGSIILPNVRIGDNVIIGAGSIVTKNIPSNVVAAGNPAKILCPIEQFLSKNKSMMENCLVLGNELSSKDLSLEIKGEINTKIDDCVGYIY
jgi:maltose O-acetyltransferase